MKTGIEIIAEERARQLTIEGWTPAHDDQHAGGEMALAAASYAVVEDFRKVYKDVFHGIMPDIWPWSKSWWKPSPDNRIKELAKAGALIAAEIDRLNRRLNPDGTDTAT